MLQDFIRKDAIDKSVRLRIIDSTDGTPETGVVFNTSGIALWYRRELGAVVAITEATLAALTTAHADGGFLHISDGYYRLDLPDAAFATGANYVEFGGTVTGMVVIGGVVKLIDSNLFHDTVRGGYTALPNAAADAAGGLPISDAGGLDLDAKLANTNEVTVARMGALTDWINGGRLDLILDIIAADTTTDIPALIAALQVFVDTEVAAILADTNELQTDWANGGRLDLIVDIIAADTTTDIPALIGAPAGGTVAAALAEIEGQTDDIGAAGAGLTAADNAILAILGTPAGASMSEDIAAMKVDTAAILVDTGTTLDGRIPAALTGDGNIKADTLRIGGTLQTANDVGGDADAIKAKTDSLTFTGANRVDANLAAVNNSTTGVDKLSAHLPAVLKVVMGVGSTTTSLVLDATTGIDGGAPSATDDFYNGRVIVFTSGALAGQATDITDYAGATGILTVTALTGGPAAAVTAVIV